MNPRKNLTPISSLSPKDSGRMSDATAVRLLRQLWQRHARSCVQMQKHRSFFALKRALLQVIFTVVVCSLFHPKKEDPLMAPRSYSGYGPAFLTGYHHAIPFKADRNRRKSLAFLINP